LKQAVAIQNVIFNEITKKRACKARIASLARAWADIEERRRILLGKPLPGVLKPEAKGRRKSSPTAFNPFRTPQQVVPSMPDPAPLTGESHNAA
jgi:hypothetical protein